MCIHIQIRTTRDAMAFIISVWQRLPVILRAVIGGFFAVTLATVPCSSLLRANFVLAPSVPWSAPLVAIYLWFYWHYLQGKGWPQSTTEFRRTNLRAHSWAGRVWRWTLLAGGLGWASILALRTLINMLFALPNDSLSKLSAYPLLLIVSYFLTASVLAGIAEEAGFRGYMQGPIERRHGPAVAILVVGLVFWLMHGSAYAGHWGLFVGQLWYYLAASAVFGTMAYLTNSILPSVVLHTMADILGFGLLWWLGSSPASSTTDEGQRDLLVWAMGLAVLVFIAAAIWAYRRLAVEARAGAMASPPSAELPAQPVRAADAANWSASIPPTTSA